MAFRVPRVNELWVDANYGRDDNDGRNDDDGVVLPSGLLLGQTMPLEVSASRSGYLQGWIDFDRNGSWAEPGACVQPRWPCPVL